MPLPPTPYLLCLYVYERFLCCALNTVRYLPLLTWGRGTLRAEHLAPSTGIPARLPLISTPGLYRHQPLPATRWDGVTTLVYSV